jgi:hypothetical protein
VSISFYEQLLTGAAGIGMPLSIHRSGKRAKMAQPENPRV